MPGGARFFEISPSTLAKDTSKDYVSRLQLLLREIHYRYVAPLPPCTDVLHSHHSWIHNTLGPMTSWPTSQLDILEETTFTIAERSYPFADIEVKAIIAKLTALAFFIDDSLETNTAGIYDEIGSFAYHVLMGESQPSAILELYHKCIKELAQLYEGDAVLRGLATAPWFNYIDGCLLEKRLLTMDAALRASPHDMGYQNLVKQRQNSGDRAARDTSPGAKVHFPLFVRRKTGAGEAYAAAIFKSTKGQGLPLSRYIMAIPDMAFYVVAVNDVLSFHKEELAGETINMIHLQTQSFRECTGSGASGKWTVLDTFNHLCNELRDATYRIDEILRLHDCERIVKEGMDSRDMGLSDVDVTIALQWRGFRDGYISWHLESQRYKLDFLRSKEFEPN